MYRVSPLPSPRPSVAGKAAAERTPRGLRADQSAEARGCSHHSPRPLAGEGPASFAEATEAECNDTCPPKPWRRRGVRAQRRRFAKTGLVARLLSSGRSIGRVGGPHPRPLSRKRAREECGQLITVIPEVRRVQ